MDQGIEMESREKQYEIGYSSTTRQGFRVVHWLSIAGFRRLTAINK
jgi:hypothetical protein